MLARRLKLLFKKTPNSAVRVNKRRIVPTFAIFRFGSAKDGCKLRIQM